jgi:methylmalonyl-CoA mutase cobalamin-binding subunit
LLKSDGQITPEQAQQVSPEAVQQIAAQAKQANPSIVDGVSSFYAEHTTLCKTLGGAALSIALAKVAQRTQHA